jgi:hypothetical protein
LRENHDIFNANAKKNAKVGGWIGKKRLFDPVGLTFSAKNLIFFFRLAGEIGKTSLFG